MRRVTILVCGEPQRGDDAVAEAVIASLPPSTMALADLRRVGQLMPDDLDAGGDAVIVLDAVDGPTPGEVIDLPLASLVAGRAERIRPASSHVLPLAMTLAIAGHLGGQLPDGRFIGVAGSDYRFEVPLSPAVRAAVPQCTARLNRWVRALAHEGRRAVACA